MSEARVHLLIVNPSSGGGRGAALLPRVEAAMHSHGLEFETAMTRSLEHGVSLAVDAHEGGRVPVVLSGDGLVGQAGGALAGRGATMGLLPGGRGNDLARVLGIPDDPEGAVGLLARGEARQIDVGEVNGRRFLCIASMGFDSEANRIANEARFIRGNLVYAYAALRALAAWKPARFTISCDGGEPFELTGFAVAAANSRAYGGGMFIAPDAELDDGLLDVVTTGRVSKPRFLINLPKVFKGTHIREPAVDVHRAATVEVSADRPFAVYADGEHLADLPASVRVLGRSLGVFAPPGGIAP